MRGICELCGNWEDLEEHHVFPGPLRKISTKYNAKAYLCVWCHQVDPDSVHRCRATAEALKAKTQRRVMQEQKWSLEDWLAAFGKSYLDEEELAELGAAPENNIGAFRVMEDAPLFC
jgi:hypothetical protein